MSFVAIINRLKDILDANREALVAGLDSRQLAIEGGYPCPHFSPQVIFIWREGLTDIEYGQISNSGQGSLASGEIDGAANFIIAAYLRYTGAEGDPAAEQLNILAWNLLNLMGGYTRDTTGAYLSAFLTSTTPDYQNYGTTSGAYVGERFTYNVRWACNF